MASIQSKVLYTILKTIGIKKMINKMFDSGHFDQNDINFPPQKLYNKLIVEKSIINERNVFKLSPKIGANNTHIIYLHGGAYVCGFSRIHWDFFDLLVQSTHCTLIIPDYPLAPKFTYKDSYKLLDLVYANLKSKLESKNIILMGDSSGGGFALAFAQKLKNDGKPNVNQIILLSPWLDLTMENKDMENIEVEDPILEISGLKRAGEAYAGDTLTSNYLLSPIYESIEGLGKISIFIGTKDILEADTRKFKKMADEKGHAINYFVYKDMIHVWMLLNLPESKQAINQISNLVLTNSEIIN